MSPMPRGPLAAPIPLPEHPVTARNLTTAATRRNPPACHECGEPVSCHPTGHHCPNCGAHDDTACEKFPEPQPGEEPWYAETITLPANLFDALLLGYRRRDLYRFAVTGDTPMLHAIRELAAAHATGSRRLTPMGAFRLAQNLVAIVAGAEERSEDEALFCGVLDQMTPDQQAACRAVSDAEAAASMAEYRAWRAQQLEAQGTP